MEDIRQLRRTGPNAASNYDLEAKVGWRKFLSEVNPLFQRASRNTVGGWIMNGNLSQLTISHQWQLNVSEILLPTLIKARPDLHTLVTYLDLPYSVFSNYKDVLAGRITVDTSSVFSPLLAYINNPGPWEMMIREFGFLDLIPSAFSSCLDELAVRGRQSGKLPRGNEIAGVLQEKLMDPDPKENVFCMIKPAFRDQAVFNHCLGKPLATATIANLLFNSQLVVFNKSRTYLPMLDTNLRLLNMQRIVSIYDEMMFGNFN